MVVTKSISSYTSASTLKSMQLGSEVYLLAIAQSFLFTCTRWGFPATYY